MKIPNVLVIGGSGYVANLILPLIAHQFNLHIFDRNPPAWLKEWEKGRGGEGEKTVGSRQSAGNHQAINSQLSTLNSQLESPTHTYTQGDVTNPQALATAAHNKDILLYMAMGRVGPDGINVPSVSHDVNVKGVHLALEAAVNAGIKKAVYTSSLSVYDGQLDIRSGVTDSEEVPARPRTVYGFTKLLGEEVCAYIHRTHNLPVVALRLFHPVSVADWHAKHPANRSAEGSQQEAGSELRTQNSELPYCHTAALDLARAVSAALSLEHEAFEIVHVTGDTTGRAYHHEKAKRLLNWEPQQRL